VRCIDDDDIRVDEDKVKKQLEILLKDKNMAAVGTNYIRTDENRNPLAYVDLPETDEAIRKIINFRNPMLQSSLCAPVAAIMKA
jgi:hypothetical protein